MSEQRYGYRVMGLFVEHGSVAYRLLAALVWRPYHWVKYRQAPELRVFMIRRRIWGGERIDPVRRAQLRMLLETLQEG